MHIRETPGFNIGAAGQPPHCRNSLHSHRTAEVFFVHRGRWRFFWGRHGDAGEVVLEEGDIFDIPTGIFRGFENVGTDYGMIMAILGGDDAGGGVTWAPQVIEDARAHGLVLSDEGRLYDTTRGQRLPEGALPMPLLSEDELVTFPELPVSDVVPRYVARYQDMMALAAKAPARVIAKDEALICDGPGFEVEFLARGSLTAGRQTNAAQEVILIHRGHWRLEWDNDATVLAPGDVCSMAAGVGYGLAPSMNGEASLFRVRRTDAPAGALSR